MQDIFTMNVLILKMIRLLQHNALLSQNREKYHEDYRFVMFYKLCLSVT